MGIAVGSDAPGKRVLACGVCNNHRI